MLIGSLLMNAILMVGLLMTTFNARQAMLELVAESAESKYRLQQEILDQLESGDRRAIQSLKKTLRFNIDVEERISYRLRTRDAAE
jgi:hypothetical protein